MLKQLKIMIQDYEIEFIVMKIMAKKVTGLTI